MSFALLLVWLLFLTQATQAAWSLLVIGAVPVGLYVLRNAAARVTRGQWLLQGEEVSAVSAIADRCMLALVLVAAAFALIDIWQIDMASVASSETAMTRLGRGTFEALVILLGADLLWLVLRAVIDLRLTGVVLPIDDLDDEELRRRARIRTLLPVPAELPVHLRADHRLIERVGGDGAADSGRCWPVPASSGSRSGSAPRRWCAMCFPGCSFCSTMRSAWAS